MRNIGKTLLAVLAVSVFVVWPVNSYADSSDHDGHTHDSGHAHASTSSHDSGHHDNGHHDRGFHERSYIGVNFTSWPDNYYYSAPYYPQDDDVIVSPPDDDYQAVAPPVTVVVPPAGPVVTTFATVSASGSGELDSITVNIPNNKGGYTAVTLKRSGNGYIGPQGEFYPEFPKVSQLKVIYGK